LPDGSVTCEVLSWDVFDEGYVDLLLGGLLESIGLCSRAWDLVCRVVISSVCVPDEELVRYQKRDRVDKPWDSNTYHPVDFVRNR